jgi:formate hydrogenlyase subunit 4
MTSLQILAFIACILFLPFITLGVIRKTKAKMQNRIGASIFQPIFDIVKMLRKGQTISETTTWIFQFSSALNVAIILLVACIAPWLSFKPIVPGDDLFLLLYLLAAIRFMTILSAIDPGSSFGAFGSSREAFMSVLAEPAMFMSLASLGLIGGSTSLHMIFDYTQPCTIYEAPVWFAGGMGFFLASLVDLSRMPIDDPTTHLELTMVHEAMHLENSGKNLALTEFAHFLKLVVLYGVAAQCILHGLSSLLVFDPATLAVLSVVGVIMMGVITGLEESVSVKLQWRRTPEFIAYALTMSFFTTAGALIGGTYASHGL